MLTTALAAVNCSWAESFAGAVQEPVAQTFQLQQQAQAQADAWEAQRVKMVAEVERLQHQQQQLQAEKMLLTRQVDASRADIAELQRAIAESQHLTAQMQPLLQDTVQQLEKQVDHDLPFLAQERQARLQNLNVALADEKLSLGEKFRRVMEALQVEIEYGSNVDVTQRTLQLNGREVLMNQVRIGRLAMFAQSLDGQRSVIYDLASQRWQAVASTYNREIGRAVEMGLKNRPVDLLTLPIGRVVR
jgi:chromosome segregation ATPase